MLSVIHEAANNLGSQAVSILQATDVEQRSYRNRFTAAPATARLVAPLPLRPTAPGPQTAIVVAAQGQSLTTDRDARIRIQFAWQRGDAPLPGALSAPTTPAGADTGHAPGDATSGTWVRVAQSVAGPSPRRRPNPAAVPCRARSSALPSPCCTSTPRPAPCSSRRPASACSAARTRA